MSDDDENTFAAAIGSSLEGLFDAVALTRREHFRRHPEERPSRADAERIAVMYANQAAVCAGALNLVPGPWGLLVIVPEILLILRAQIQMIYDLGVAQGKEAHLDGPILLGMFATLAGEGTIGLVTIKGGQLVVKRASLRVLQRIVAWLGGKITQAVLKQLLAKWVPVLGAAAMAVWTRQTTLALGRRRVVDVGA